MQWWCAASGVPWEWKWTAYPGVWIFVALLAVAFRSIHRRWGSAEDGARAVWGYVAILTIWVALDWPVGALAAGYLASVKMVQYLLLSLIAAPLLLMGLPRDLYRAIEERVGTPFRVVTHPLVAMPVFVVIMAWTHWAPVVDALMVQQIGSFFMDAIWIVAGVLFWWPVSAPRPVRSWLGDPARIGYLIVATLVNTGVFAYLTFAELPLYGIYELAPPVTGLSTRDDQRLAGLLMKIGGAVILWTAISILFFRWATRDVEADGRDRERPRSIPVAGLLLLLAGASACAGGGEAGAGDAASDEAATGTAAAAAAEASDVGVAGAPSPDADGSPGGIAGALDGVRIPVAVIGRPPLPGRAALYLTLVNAGDGTVSVVGVEVDGVGRASLHRTTMSNGTMSMAPVERFDAAPGERLELRPGGLHVMLEEPLEGVFDPDEVGARLLLEDGRVIEMTVQIVPLADLEEALGG